MLRLFTWSRLMNANNIKHWRNGNPGFGGDDEKEEELIAVGEQMEFSGKLEVIMKTAKVEIINLTILVQKEPIVTQEVAEHLGYDYGSKLNIFGTTITKDMVTNKGT